MFEDKRLNVSAKFALLVAYCIALAGERAALFLNVPVLGSHYLKDENIVVVPVRREAFPIRWRQVEVGLKPMAQLRGQHPAEQSQLWLPVMQLIQDQRAAGSHIVENGLQPLRHAFV